MEIAMVEVYLYLSMIFSENRCPPRIKCGAGFFRIMLDAQQVSPAS